MTETALQPFPLADSLPLKGKPEAAGGCGKPECGTSGCGSKNTAERKIWEIRTEEQVYAFLNDKTVSSTNRYGQKIDLIEHTQGKLPVGRSMFINENPAVGSNPNRNKQHGFFFTADNCIGCHACEAACSEQNDNPAHLAFRSVGYVEGGSFPDYKRMNISMACNHCDDPVCLKGCPTRAYTKHVEYGAVLQDPETCFGCGYCTWVCPYNAPQLDPVKGQVSKCNMCVDRLEVGLKPACVSACVGNALDFLRSLLKEAPFAIQGIKTDNGSIFTNRYNGYYKSTRAFPRMHAFTKECRRHGIVHYLIDPGKPAQNGKVERSHRTDRAEFWSKVAFRSLKELQRKQSTYVDWYNTQREHLGIGGKTPMELLQSVRHDVA